ncbi:diguanylate cyclase [Simiduia curdlanivorans]|uniref:diguanylate cyclase n=1 Tax=Simiduia curdlanivorans TaxID=1492769 RepID=A0ABV8V354_9GAMM|nr:tetratricopeptide repeat-containing diguanylate cyclase [Simiduia curdlanivorans]MDN3638341.1 diguanylate cyclase [Simiduia curdlanivorans]
MFASQQTNINNRIIRLAIMMFMWASLSLSAPSFAEPDEFDQRSIDAQFTELENSELIGGRDIYLEKLALLKSRLNPNDPLQQMRYRQLACWYQPEETALQIQAAIANASTWMREASALKNITAEAEFLLCRGWFRQFGNDMAGAKMDFETALKIAEMSEHRRLIADALSSRGELLSNQGDLALALEDLQVAYQMYHLLGNRYWSAYTLSMVANTYRRMGDLSRAKTLLEEVVDLYQARGDIESVMDTNYILALTYDDLGEYARALAIYMDVLKYYQNNKVPHGQLTSYIAIADNRLRAGDSGAAASALQSAEPLLDKDYDASSWALWHLFSAYLDVANKKYADALMHLENASPIVVALDNNRYLSWVQKLQADVYGALGRWQQAFESLQAYQATSDLLSSKLRDQTSTRMRIEFDTARKEAENQALKSEQTVRESRIIALQEKRRWQVAVISLSMVVLIFIALFGLRQWRRSKHLHIIAMTDELTRLPNRRSIYVCGNAELEQARKQGTAFSIIVFDVDHFKRINDTWGHNVGDRVLQKIAEYSQLALRKNDKIGRTGGEEFLAILPGADTEQAVEVAQRLCACVEDMDMRAVADDLAITISLGVAQLRDADKDLSKLMQRADSALYMAKHAGRNRVEVATE